MPEYQIRDEAEKAQEKKPAEHKKETIKQEKKDEQ